MTQIPAPKASQTSLAYIAGLFDGEGCVLVAEYVYQNGSPRLWLDVSIANTHEPTIDFVNSVFPGSVSHKLLKSSRLIWTWRVTSRKAKDFLDQIYPYARVKASQIVVAQSFQERVDTTPLTGQPISEEELMVRRGLKATLSQLKREPVPSL